MTGWWREYPRMPKYVNRLEDGHKNSSRAALPILDAWLTAIPMSSILAKKSVPTAQEKWDELPTLDKTWAKWKENFLNSQASIELATRASGSSFGIANAAAVLDNITHASAPHPSNTSALPPANDSTVLTNTVDRLN